MGSDSVALRDDESGLVLRHYTYYRPTILVLLKEHESHGYELTSRMTELGFDQRLASNIYKVLRDMEREGLIISSWDVSRHGGPPRRMYALAEAGDQFLQGSLPALVRQRHALGALLELYRALYQEDPTYAPIPVAAVGTARGSSEQPVDAGPTNMPGRRRPRKR